MNPTVLELFAGGGGMALGFERAGLNCVMLNELNKDACNTLRKNRPGWNVVEGDVRGLNFNVVADIVAGGFPCQSFSYAGKRLGLEDTRGTLFYEFARAVKEVTPFICVGENVRGLLNHDQGSTLAGMVSVLDEIGYEVIPPKIIKAIHHKVPQKRERIFIVGLRKGSGLSFNWPVSEEETYTVKDALKKGRLYDTDTPSSDGQVYPSHKKEIMDMVPAGGYWRDLPIEVQKKYMGAAFFSGGGRTGIARRLAWNTPSPTLMCSPAQKQTECCHPDETRSLTIREYARIQTFPDTWDFSGSVSSQYAQIGNAVPVSLAEAIGRELAATLRNYYERTV